MSSKSSVSGVQPDMPTTRLHGLTYVVVLSIGALGLLMAINQTFTLGLLGFQPLGNAFLYYLIGLFLAVALLIYPARAADKLQTP